MPVLQHPLLSSLFLFRMLSISSLPLPPPTCYPTTAFPSMQRVGPQSDSHWVERRYILWAPQSLVPSHPEEGAMQPNLLRSPRLMSHMESKPSTWPALKLSPPCVSNELLLGWQEKLGEVHVQPPMLCFTEVCKKYHCHHRSHDETTSSSETQRAIIKLGFHQRKLSLDSTRWPAARGVSIWTETHFLHLHGSAACLTLLIAYSCSCGKLPPSRIN